MIETWWPSLACLTAAGGLVVVEFRGAEAAQRVLKPLAASLFIVQALVAGATGSLYGSVILLALILSALGDVLLLPRERPAIFKAGMAAFGAAHLAYVTAFLLFLGEEGGPLSILSAPVALVLVLFAIRWLYPHLGGADRVAVTAYAALIGLMVVGALIVAGATLPLFVALAALMFAVSDLFVARDRFVNRSPLNSLVITPLYFGAQCLFALSVAFVGNV